MWKFEEFRQQTELVHEVESRRMNRVTTEVAKEVGVLLQHNNLDPSASEQETEHHATRPTTGDDAGGLDFFGRRCVHRPYPPQPALHIDKVDRTAALPDRSSTGPYKPTATLHVQLNCVVAPTRVSIFGRKVILIFTDI